MSSYDMSRLPMLQISAIEFKVSRSYQSSEGSMFEEKKAANKFGISASVEATTSPYDIVEGIDECDFLS